MATIVAYLATSSKPVGKTGAATAAAAVEVAALLGKSPGQRDDHLR